MTRARFARTTFAAAATIAAGCTFGGIGDYETRSCPPAAKASDDVCDKLHAADACHPYQCDGEVHRCIARARDDDRDGDPAIACGGHDCDDNDPTRASTKKEICNLIDDDCNGYVDDGIEYAASPVGAPLASGYSGGVARTSREGSVVVGAAIAGAAVEVLRVADDAQATQTIALGGDAAQQPSATFVDGHAVAAYVATDAACASGRFSFRNDAGGSVAQPCSATTNGVAAPAIAAFPSKTGAGAALVALDDVTVARTSDPAASCDLAAGAPLLVAAVRGAATATPTMTPFATLAADAIALRPPALARLDGFGSVLVAAPTPSAVAVWSVTPDLAAPSVARLGELAGAKAVAIAVSSDADHTRVAVVAEIGCAPHQRLRAAFGTASGVAVLADGGLAPPVVAFGALVDVTPADAARAGAPSVAWIDAAGEWEIAWLGEAGGRARRYAPDGTALDAGVDLGRVAAAVAPRSAADRARAHEIVVFDAAAKEWVRIALSCPR